VSLARSASAPRGRLVLGCLILAGALAALAAGRHGAGAVPATAPVPQPALGAADPSTVLMGGASAGASGEVWSYRLLPLDVPPPVAGGPLPFAPVAQPTSPLPQLAFARATASTGWQYVETPQNADGTPYRGFQPNARSARITPHAGGVLVGRDATRAQGDQVVVLDQNPAGRFTVLPDPPPGVLLPANAGTPGEALAGDQGTGSVAVAAEEEGGRSGLFLGPVGQPVENAVVHWTGTAWAREPVDLPAGSPASFNVLAISATSPANAWLLASTDASLGDGILLYHRVTDASGAHWAQQPLGPSAADFTASATPTDGVSSVAALGGSAEPLTVTTAGVWIDGSLAAGAKPYDFSLYFDINQGQVTGSWCDAPKKSGGTALCNHGLGSGFSHQAGYRSFAWPGPSFGTRIVTNPIAVGGDDTTNNGTYLRFDSGAVRRMPGGGGDRRPSGAFDSVEEGWLEGPVHVTQSPEPGRLEPYPLSLRAPLGGIVQSPGTTNGDPNAQALAVGGDGGVVRYSPTRGWNREFLLTESGTVARPLLRAVAWPEPGRAYAVGDLGAMWLWQATTGLWESDPAKPLGGFQGNLMGVAFDPADARRGYAVGKAGLLLRYDKTWTQDALPAGFGQADLTAVSFAGREAMAAAGRDVVENDGGAWHVDGPLHALLASLPRAPQIFTVTGLPDGGALAAGPNVVFERDGGPGSPWRSADQPLPSSTVVAAGGYRDGSGRVRAVVSVVPLFQYPIPDVVPIADPNTPPPIIPPFPLPGDGYVLREIPGAGWRDEEHTAFAGSTNDRPVKADPVLGFDLDPATGQGWAAGGWDGQPDSAGRGDSSVGGAGDADRANVQTAAVFRYQPAGGGPAPPASGTVPVALPAGPVRFAVAAHAACDTPCADLAAQGLGPDATLADTLGKVAGLTAQGNGPRFMVYAGGRLKAGASPVPAAEEQRFASLLGGQPSLPVYAAASAGDSAGGSVAAFGAAFAGFAAPFGSGGAPSGVTPQGTAPAGGGANTHYAFDSAGSGGTIRVIVIDNSSGSLATSDPHQVPAEAQLPWLTGQLDDARSRAIPAVVVGSRDLNPRFSPAINSASDGTSVATVLLQHGASAYFFERPEENRSATIPAGSSQTIPTFATGTIGYRSPIANNPSGTDELFGDTGYLLAEVNAARRDAATNRAPVSVRLIPTIDDLSLQAVDGTLLRRSRPSLFQGLGRRPVAGDRWGPTSGDAGPNPPGSSPYTSFPPGLCLTSTCSTRITPEYQFSSSDPDIGAFVEQDPNSRNLRKPLLGANDKVIADSSSGLFCPFNAGTTTVTVSAGGLSFSSQLTVLNGTVARPCGTVPLNPARFKRQTSATAPVPPPPVSPAPAPSPAPPIQLPPLPTLTPTPALAPAPVPALPPPPLPAPVVLPPVFPILPLVGLPTPVLPILPPGAPGVGRPIPPSGAVARAYQVKREEEEEAAPEQSQAFSRYQPDTPGPIEPYVVGMVLVAALAGASIRGMVRGRGGRRPAPVPISSPNGPASSRGRRPPGR